jgi:DNA-binding MarR family transcriptional regulator
LTSLLDRVLELALLLNEDATRGVAKVGLTLPRVHLTWLLHHHGPQTQRALAEAVKVTPRNITGLVDGLVDTGFVTREPHPTDRRATLVSLTERGEATMAAMDREHQELAELLFADVPDRDAFERGLDHLLGRLRDATA